ncbi:tol-pal system protein YbgF [Acidithiobacillus sp. IBUN Pt1247-S3]|uniref:tol-pal system protein YbgF n=1 Tax=Acidithiobacillus sp. IBUN Pt1247-S3 TaxID=3166642 RepID=UPI0034E508B6
MKVKLTAALAAAVLLASSPVWADSEGQQILQLQQQMAVMQSEVQSLIAVQKASRGSQTALGDLLDRSQHMQQEIRELRGDLESKTHALESAQQEINAKLAALSTAVATTSSVTASTASTSSAAVSSTTPAGAIAAEASSAASSTVQGLGQAEYQRAFALLQAGKYGTAATSLQAFIHKYPQSSLVVDAYYWLGQAQYVLGQNDAAIKSLTTAAQHTQSSKAPDALLRMGQIYEAIGQPAKARATFNRILKQYPSTPAAQKAQTQLQASGH